MACSRLVFLTLVLSVVGSFAVQVPVFLWGDLSKAGIKSNPLSKVSSEDFHVTLKRELASNPCTVIFIEETLSVEDFSHKNAEGDTCFPYLHDNLADATYLPSVENALRVLNRAAEHKQVQHLKLTEGGLSADVQSDADFIFINLKDAREGESRADLLHRHNDFMEDLYSKLQESHDSVVAIYTAHYPSWIIPVTHSRVRRQASNESSANTAAHDYSLDGLRLYTKGILLGETAKITPLDTMTSSSTTFNGTQMTTEIKFAEASLMLNFRSKMGYWFFDSVTVSTAEASATDLPAVDEVYAIDGFSYRCGERVLFASNNQTELNVTFVDMKVQPFFKTMNSSEMKFGDSFNCVGFFSVPIWSGLFVVLIMLSITFYGILMMLDIRTMDRFDDPKGKTITINAGE